jgi:hypothetical protein
MKFSTVCNSAKFPDVPKMVESVGSAAPEIGQINSRKNISYYVGYHIALFLVSPLLTEALTELHARCSNEVVW